MKREWWKMPEVSSPATEAIQVLQCQTITISISKELSADGWGRTRVCILQEKVGLRIEILPCLAWHSHLSHWGFKYSTLGGLSHRTHFSYSAWKTAFQSCCWDWLIMLLLVKTSEMCNKDPTPDLLTLGRGTYPIAGTGAWAAPKRVRSCCWALQKRGKKVSLYNFGPIKASFFFPRGHFNDSISSAFPIHKKAYWKKNHPFINKSSFTCKFSAWCFACLVFSTAVAKAGGTSRMQTDTLIQIILVNL